MPADNSVIPLKLGGADLTQPYNSDAAAQALLGQNANPVVQSALSQVLNPVNAFFGPMGVLSGGGAGAGGNSRVNRPRTWVATRRLRASRSSRVASLVD